MGVFTLENKPYKLNRIVNDTVEGSGTLNGVLTTSGHTWSLTGTGYATTSKADGYISGASNTYCHVNTGHTVRKIVQYYRGPMATLSIGLDNGLTDMIHCNFTSNGNSVTTYWKTGVGTAQSAQWSSIIATIPDLEDGVTHKLELEVFDNLAISSVDGVVVAVSYHTNYSSVVGNWFFAQIHGGGTEKIYGVESYSYNNSEESLDSKTINSLRAKNIFSATITVGSSTDTGYSATSSSYFHTDHASGHVFGSTTEPFIHIKSTVTGYQASLKLTCAIGVSTILTSVNDGSFKLQQNGTTRMTLDYNVARVQFPSQRMLVGLPTSSAGLSVGELWVDTANGNVVKSVQA